MLTVLALHLCLQVTPPPQERQRTAVRDSTPADSIRRGKPRRLPVTAAVLATAFRDATARELFRRARRARIAQDSSLRSYDATVKQRFSVQLGVGKLGRDRLAYRRESVARVQWQRDVGARVEITGARVAIPLIGSSKAERDALKSDVLSEEMSPIPYFPGSETLWVGAGAARTEVDESEIVNPLADGAEAYYTYRSGDSVSFRLPDGRAIQLRELQVRPRSPKWNVAVGSLWFDTESGQLVRAAYRLAAPARANVSVASDDSTAKAPKVISFVMTSLLSPNSAQISAVAVEYGLYEGRYWLPRLQSVEGVMTAMFARVPIKYENAFNYSSVNGTLEVAKFAVDTTVTDDSPELARRPPPGLDSAARRKWRDSTLAVYRASRKAREDSVKAGMRIGTMRQCDTATTRVVTEYRYEDARLPVLVRAPCDLEKLARSPDLPASIYDPGEEVFGSADRDRLLAEALSLAAQAPLSLGALPRPRFQLGPSMTRYNRVEGWSTGLGVDQQLGAGYSAAALGRFGFADRVPNYELSFARTNLSKTIRLSGYRRLSSASDWGDPLTFRSSLAAFLFGQDEGFYYRTTGAELLWTSERGARLHWRAFTERQHAARQRTTYSVGGSFGPNIAADAGLSAGAAVRFLGTYGLDPRGVRLFSDLRLEGASGDSTYGRGALDLTLSRDLVGKIAGALTVAGGSTVGQVPMQRRWFLGGTYTVRGQSPDTAQSGTAFWLGRLELARTQVGFRTALFGDLGWTGDRAAIGDVKRPMSGVGIGISGFDGLIRLDVARGLYPRKQTRLGFYLDARF
jgi:hypothetical protein